MDYRRIFLRMVTGLAIAQALTGCGSNFNSIYRETSNEEVKTVLIDAKQRAIISNKIYDKLVVCAEKSPDAFSVLSAAASGNLSYNQLAAGFSGSSSESGVSIGLRTQLTQAQAEFLYRLCEQYANGAISQATVETELRRFPTTIVALLAIEQLTGYAKPNFVAIGGKGTAGMAADLGDMQKAVDQARSEQQQKQAAAADASKKAQDAQKTLDDKNAAKQKLLAGVDTTQADKDIAAATAALQDARDKQTAAIKASTDDATAVDVAQKILDQKKAAKQKLLAGVDTTQADQDIKNARAELQAAKDKRDIDVKAATDAKKKVQAMQKTLTDKKAAKKRLGAGADTAKADKDIKNATDALQAAKDKQTVAIKALADDATAVDVAQKILDQKKAAKQKLLAGVDTTQADQYIVAATTALTTAQDKKTADAKLVTAAATAVNDAQKTLEDKNAEKKKLVDTMQADKEIADATAVLKTALDKKKATDDATKDSANNLKQIEAARDAASHALSASTSSTPAQFFDAKTSNYYEANPQSVREIAHAVTDIVRAVTYQTFTTEVCLKAFFEDQNPGQLSDTWSFCRDWMKDINRWKFENLYLTHGVMPDGMTSNPAMPAAVRTSPVGEGPIGTYNPKAPQGPYFVQPQQMPTPTR